MRTITAFAILLFAASPLHAELVAPNNSQRLEYRTSWLGNTYGGLNPETGKGQWVQQDIAALCVTPDGTVYTNVPWEEGGGNCMMYKDGEMLGHSRYTHGWGFNGGKAVAVNDKYVFIALMGNNEGGGLNDPDTWPPKGFDWYGVSRRLRSDFTKGAPFEHGKGGKGDTLPKSFLVINEVSNEQGRNAIDGPGAITGLWADNERLYVSNPLENRVEIYDTETMLKIEEWNLPENFQGQAGQIAMDPDGNLWMLANRPRRTSFVDRFLVFDKSGKFLTRRTIDGEVPYAPLVSDTGRLPTAFCFDNVGRLLVAVSRLPADIVAFEKREGEYVLPPRNRRVQFGLTSQVLRTGVHGDLIFHNIKAIGSDVQGNLYIASDWATNGGGAILESYAPTTGTFELDPQLMHGWVEDFYLTNSPRHWKLNWRLYGLCFIDCATLDPDDETMVYTKEEKYKIDWSKEPGQEWSFLGSTIATSYGQSIQSRDPRLHIKDSASVWVRNLDGKKFLFVNDMSAVRLQVYEVDIPEVIAPDRQSMNRGVPGRAAVLFSPQRYRNRDGSEPTEWLPGQPEKGEWIWTNSERRDTSLRMNEAEFAVREPEVRGIEGWWVDSKGDVWQTTFNQGLRRFRYQGLDNIGNPIWNFENMDTFPHPQEFNQVKRIRYYPETDTLYLGGCATVDGKEHKNQHWKPMGPVIARYDNFLKGENPGTTEGKLKWLTVLPYVVGSQGHESCEPMGFDVAGDYIFVPYTGASRAHGVKTGRVEVLRADDASPVGWMEPCPQTVGEIGLQDIRECLSAHRLKSGEYVIFLEDDYKAKVVMYRWMP